MKIEKRSSDEERRILIGMIVDSIVLGRIGSKWKSRMFRSKWANIVAGWCLQYYEKYEEAPLSHIESLYETWTGTSEDKNVIDLVGKFLASLSEEYEELKDESNSDYIIDLAGRHFNQVQIEKLMESMQSDIDRGKTVEAHRRLSSYNQIEMGLGKGIDVLQDTEAIKKAFESKAESLVRYPGDLGKFFGNAFERGGFISFMGPEKRGKSFWLADVAYRGMLERRRVALFEAGDMGEDSIIRRLMVRVAKCPLYPITIRYPKSIQKSFSY